MAGAGYKLFNTGDVLLASEVNTYLQQQTVMVFASSTARTTALSGVLAEGMMSYLQDTNSVEVYNGSSWVNVGNAGDITGVTAGTGISGGGTSGDVTITNSMATAIDAKGDLIVGTGADTFSRLAVGTNGHTLVADSSTATGLKWAAAAGGGDLTLIARTSFSNVASQSFDNFSSTYENYLVYINYIYNVNQNDADLRLTMRYGGTDGTNHYGTATRNAAGATTWTNTNTSLGANYVTISTDTGVAASPHNSAIIYFTGTGFTGSGKVVFWGTFFDAWNYGQTLFFGANDSAQTYTGFKLASSTQNIDGVVSIYGLKK